MKKLRFFSVLAALLALSLAFAACGDDDDGGDPAISGTVSISGTNKVDQTLTANATLDGTNGAVSYQWLRADSASAAGTAIAEATGSTYTLVAADKDKFIKVQVSREGYTGTKTSSPTKKVLASDAADLSGSVSITGTAKVGQTLTANISALDGDGTPSYQWTRLNAATDTSGAAIGTDSDTYTVVADDAGKFISVTVSREGYAGTATADSAKGPVATSTSSGGGLTIKLAGPAYIGGYQYIELYDGDTKVVSNDEIYSIVGTVTRADDAAVKTYTRFEEKTFDVATDESPGEVSLTGTVYLKDGSEKPFSGSVTLVSIRPDLNGTWKRTGESDIEITDTKYSGTPIYDTEWRATTGDNAEFPIEFTLYANSYSIYLRASKDMKTLQLRNYDSYSEPPENVYTKE